ncbi:MAG: hypothetical protein ACI8TX_001422 [Hyphomicrobiaceae bacterium]|jgi:hypothetical protein
MIKRSCVLRGLAVLTALAICTGAEAQPVPAPGFIYSALDTGSFLEGCVQQGPGGVFVTVGVQFTGGTPATRDVVFVSESGAQRVVATGLNAVGDCTYDAESDVLYVVDNALEYVGAVVGDTVFAVPNASTAVLEDIADHELVPSGTIPAGASISLDANGDLLISDASGGGTGRVVRVAVADGEVTSFVAGGFDFTGGLAVEADGSVLIAEADGSSFANRVHRYDSGGAFISAVSADSFAHGSVDLAIGLDGLPIATGSSTIARIDAPNSATALVTGISGTFGPAFGGGVDIDKFSGRIVFGASNFDGGAADQAIHSLVPVAELVAGRGNPRRECLSELYGVRLVPSAPGRVARHAICEDGAACDADGVADGTCTFPVGFCAGVSDPELLECAATSVEAFELLRAKPESQALTVAAQMVQAGLPTNEAQCRFSDGYEVPLRAKRSGGFRIGRAKLKVRVTADVDSRVVRDTDKFVLKCLPPL